MAAEASAAGAVDDTAGAAEETGATYGTGATEDTTGATEEAVETTTAGAGVDVVSGCGAYEATLGATATEAGFAAGA